tara:strand:+ start:328 stop:519 length:192 start_codon:yes stop_codon:yes gene_type:complete
MSKTQTFVLETRPTLKGARGERIHKVVAESYSEAINLFATIKQLRPDQLLEIYKVYEQPKDGK